VGAKESTAAVRALSGSWAASPVRVCVNVDGFDILPGIAVHKTRQPHKVAAEPLKSLPGMLRRSRHEPADLFGGELHVHSVRREIVGASSGSAVRSVELRVQRAVVL